MMQFTFDENIVSDLHKDAYGFRPRGMFWTAWDQMSDAEKQAEWDSLLLALELELEREEEAKVAAEDRWHRMVIEAMKATGGSEEDVIRWLWDAECIDDPNSQDIEMFAWELGIIHTETGRDVIKTLTRILKPKY